MTSSAAWQLAFGLVAVLVIFVVAASAKRAVAIGVLLVLIPFQMVDTHYGSSSVVIAYALTGILLINGGLKVRMLPALGLIVLAYLLSLSQASRDLITLHLIEIFQFFSCLVVFVLAYNFARLVETERAIVNVLLAINILTIVYCALQLYAGPGEQFVPFGIDVLAFNSNRDPKDPRLIGPFGNPGSTAGYFTLMIIVWAAELIFAQGRRRLVVRIVTGLNLVGLLATANRTSFLVLLAMSLALLFTFRTELGARRVFQFLIGGAAVLAIAGTIVATYTDFGLMFSRLETVTETEKGVPTTRALTWPVAIEKIKLYPWLGEGPHFFTAEDAEALGEPRATGDPYPHSLYLYLLRTVGIVGLVAVLGFFLRTWRILYGTLHRESLEGHRSAIVRLGLLLIPAFLVEQITLEFNRPDTMDYAQFIFALMGMLVGTSDRHANTAQAPEAAQSTQPMHS
jgi:O-antigen ligase